MKETQKRHRIHVSHPKMGFSCAHFVASRGVCEALHGHNYSVDITVSGELNQDGMVLDFREVKEEVGRICAELDHKVLLPVQSRLIKLNESEADVRVRAGELEYMFPKQDCALLPIAATTAELLAKYITERLQLGPGLSIEICVAENAGSRGCYTIGT